MIHAVQKMTARLNSSWDCGKRDKFCKNMEAVTIESAINLPIYTSTKHAIMMRIALKVTGV
jgi:hypothetical protein